MVISNMGVIYPGSTFVDLYLFTNFWFWGHNLGSRYVRKPIKGSKDSYDSPSFQKKLEPKNWLVELAPMAG